MGRSGSVRAPQAGGAAGERVRAARQAMGLSQAQLAEATGVSRQTILSMETGDYAPSVYLALAVARVLDTTVEAVWG